MTSSNFRLLWRRAHLSKSKLPTHPHRWRRSWTLSRCNINTHPRSFLPISNVLCRLRSRPRSRLRLFPKCLSSQPFLSMFNVRIRPGARFPKMPSSREHRRLSKSHKLLSTSQSPSSSPFPKASSFHLRLSLEMFPKRSSCRVLRHLSTTSPRSPSSFNTSIRRRSFPGTTTSKNPRHRLPARQRLLQRKSNSLLHLWKRKNWTLLMRFSGSIRARSFLLRIPSNSDRFRLPLLKRLRLRLSQRLSRRLFTRRWSCPCLLLSMMRSWVNNNTFQLSAISRALSSTMMILKRKMPWRVTLSSSLPSQLRP